MTDDHEHDHEHDHDNPHEIEGPVRQTAPQGEYTTRDVGIGFGVLLVGLVVTVLIPLVLV